MKPEHVAVRRRLREDFPFYARHALKIRTKAGEIQPLELNPAQCLLQDAIDKQMAAEGKVRIIILKARQQGLSTAVGGWMYHQVSQRKAAKALVVAHKADSTQALFDMTKRYHEHCPEILKPHTKYSSRREITFDLLDSMYQVATAGGEGIARGETITHLHASELAFWQASSARENWNGLVQAVPEVPGTAIFIESTANGVSGLFYETWKDACEGTNGYIPVFIPWFLDPDYRDVVPLTFERSPEEQELVEKYGVDDEQLAWRRKKIVQNGLDLFKQEYPAEPEEAFLTSGRPVFNPEQISKILSETAKEPIKRLALEGEEWVPHPRGELACYLPHDEGETYYIGADVGMGVRGGDYSVAQVLDSKKRQVAVWRGQVHPDYYATTLLYLGRFFNDAHIIVENNNHGILTCHKLGVDLAYPYFYTEVQKDKITDRETVKLGFTTTVKTKPMVIDELRAAMREELLHVYDKVTLREMLTYIVNEAGKMEAEEGCHDDCVMSLAFVNHIHEGAWGLVENHDDFYVEMI
jgi:hypothetical protein